jgi:hypothetical protein
MMPALLACFMHVMKLLLDVGALGAIRHVSDAFAELVLSIPQVFAMLSAAIIRRRRLTVAGCGWRWWLANRDLANSRYSDLSLSVGSM